jgi:hypothetical protein
MSVFNDQEAVKCHSSLHDKYVIVPADKASNYIVFVCKSYYFECLIKELGINSNTSSYTTYKPTSFDKDVMKRGKTLNSFLVFKYRLRSTINTIFEFVNPTLY